MDLIGNVITIMISEKELVENRVETIEDTNYDNFNIDYNDDEIVCSAPTLAQVQKWLKYKGYVIESSYLETYLYSVSIKFIKTSNILWIHKKCKTYEEALSVGIDKCIEIIKNRKGN